MHFSQRLTALLVALGFVASAASKVAPAPRNFDESRHVDLGLLDSVEHLFQYLGTNASDWKPVQEQSSFVSRRAQSQDASDVTNVALLAAPDECKEKATSDGQVCQQLPNHTPFWLSGRGATTLGVVFSGYIANARSSCQPATDGAGPWQVAVGVHVKPCANNFIRFTDCC